MYAHTVVGLTRARNHAKQGEWDGRVHPPRGPSWGSDRQIQNANVLNNDIFPYIHVHLLYLNDTISSAEILPTSYTIYRNDRINRGGVVLIAVKESIPSQICFTSDTIEMITVNMNISPKLTLACLYIPPNCSTEYQRETLNSLTSKVTLTLLFSETSMLLTLISTPTLQGHHFLVTSATLYIN